MKHLFINDYGAKLGVTNERLKLTIKDEEKLEIPLKRIKTITVLGGGASFSSNLLIKCSYYGIKFYITDHKNEISMSFTNSAWHKVVNVRKEQIFCIQEGRSITIARQLIIGKIKNQRSTMLYMNKYHSKTNPQFIQEFDNFILTCDNLLEKLQNKNYKFDIPTIMGFEGKVASDYWKTFAKLFPINSFDNRTGRGATDIINISLNFGYGVMRTFVWNCIINAGLEPYAGFLHSDRPGKPSLVLDIMEEYRAWVVDRNIIKLRSTILDKTELDNDLKKRIVDEINKTIHKDYPYHNRRVTLQSIIQRQVYKLVGCIVKKSNYKSYIFRW